MSLNRYSRTRLLKGGKMYGTHQGSRALYLAASAGTIRTRSHVLKQGERLDAIAGRELGDGSLWWVIAACSGIGWGLQVPPGTRVRITESLAEVAGIVG